MKSFKMKFSTIHFENKQKLMDCILHLDRIRLTHIDYETKLNELRLSEEQQYKNSKERQLAEKSHIVGIFPTYEYDTEKLTLDIHTEGGAVAAYVQSNEHHSSDSTYVMGDYFDFFAFFEIQAIQVHPVHIIYETYESGKLAKVELIDVSKHKTMF